MELFRVSGAAQVVDEQVRIKQHRRGATELEIVESLLYFRVNRHLPDLARIQIPSALPNLAQE